MKTTKPFSPDSYYEPGLKVPKPARPAVPTEGFRSIVNQKIPTDVNKQAKI
jgi:hypothetical protein